ncbi:DUF4136 domain-containing protein [Aquincola sp. S2]|uniref:DUF4136 domain-containing protein n=1 Tax=Pseudaquabacterium terrae TaxID=2732868 RepID=A0ABX2EFG1_9BURK|nr:DUF4136 domain-containing protein [Aquabacterium terrae]NRF67326.1 DUF4136 domain-containing protein [Aquabacterium terrae]
MPNHLTPSRRAAILGLLAAVLAATGCASKPDVRHDQDAAFDVKAYRTFAFYEPATLHYTTLLEQRLRQATREQLERAHYVYDERDPDLRVNYLLQVVDKQALRSTPSPRLGYRGWNGGNLETIDVREGTLAIDLVDARRNLLMWRAVAEGRIDDKAAQQPGPAIDAVVAELFTRLPAGAAAAR